MRRLPLTVKTVVATAAILNISPYSPVTTLRAAPETAKINWIPCHRETGRPFECGTVQVPLDYDGPGAAAISIALIRLAHTGPSTRIGSLFLNPGGPGGSGVDFLITTAPF